MYGMDVLDHPVELRVLNRLAWSASWIIVENLGRGRSKRCANALLADVRVTSSDCSISSNVHSSQSHVRTDLAMLGGGGRWLLVAMEIW